MAAWGRPKHAPIPKPKVMQRGGGVCGGTSRTVAAVTARREGSTPRPQGMTHVLVQGALLGRHGGWSRTLCVLHLVSVLLGSAKTSVQWVYHVLRGQM